MADVPTFMWSDKPPEIGPGAYSLDRAVYKPAHLLADQGWSIRRSARTRIQFFAKYRGASRSQLDTLALQLALNGIEGDLKREHGKCRPADYGGASKDQERRHLNTPAMASHSRQTRMPPLMVNILPAGLAAAVFWD